MAYRIALLCIFCIDCVQNRQNRFKVLLFNITSVQTIFIKLKYVHLQLPNAHNKFNIGVQFKCCFRLEDVCLASGLKANIVIFSNISLFKNESGKQGICLH